jgi:hypothetical protein
MRISSLLASAALILSVSACGYASFTSSDAAADTAQEADTNQASTVTIDGTNFEISGFDVINPDEGADAFALFFVANDV